MSSSTQTEKAETQALQQAAKQQQTGCCGGPAPKGAEACCALDADVKAGGGAGCGCAPKAASGAPRKGCC